MKIAKYIRVSTVIQDIGSQRSQIEEFMKYYRTKNKIESEKEYKDEMSGASLERPQLDALKNDILTGKIDTVVAVKLDRLSRSMQDLLLLFEFFKQQNVVTVLIKENLDTSTAQGRLLFHIMGAFVEFERETIRERLIMGKEKAKIYGTKSGKPMNRPRINFNLREAKKLRDMGLSYKKIANQLGVKSGITIKMRLEGR